MKKLLLLTIQLSVMLGGAYLQAMITLYDKVEETPLKLKFCRECNICCKPQYTKIYGHDKCAAYQCKDCFDKMFEQERKECFYCKESLNVNDIKIKVIDFNRLRFKNSIHVKLNDESLPKFMIPNSDNGKRPELAPKLIKRSSFYTGIIGGLTIATALALKKLTSGLQKDEFADEKLLHISQNKSTSNINNNFDLARKDEDFF